MKKYILFNKYWSSVVHGCRLSAIELFRLPLSVS